MKLRTKISNCVRKPGNAVPDEDAPNDPESTKYWTTTTVSSTATDAVKQKLQVDTKVEASADMASDLLSSTAPSFASTATPSEVAAGYSAHNADTALALLADIRRNGAGSGLFQNYRCAATALFMHDFFSTHSS